MAAANTTPPPLLPVNPDGIPMQMRSLKRWCVWVATWIPERGKYDKRPVSPATGAGLSSRDISKWATFDVAFAAYKRNPSLYAGLGFVIAKGDNIFCIDLDKCMPNGAPDAKARDVITAVQTFTEYSPSGEGAHLWGSGEVGQDCVKGVEVYQGNSPRYVTVTGTAIAGAPETWRSVVTDVLQAVIDTYGQRKTTAEVIEMQAPEILDPLVLPDTAELDLPYTVADFLDDGERGTKDRSLMLFQTAIALHNAGLTTQEVFSVMVNNHHTMQSALEKRNGDDDKAIDYLWLHHAQKAKPKSDATRVTLDDFDDVPDLLETDARIAVLAPEPLGAGMFDDVSTEAGPRAEPPKPKGKFAFMQVAEYVTNVKPLNWFIKGVLPRAEVGVVYGESGAGKSFFALDLVAAVARGGEWRGIKVRNQGRVAYVVAEGSSGFALRMEAYCAHHGMSLGELDIFALPAAPNLLQKPEVKELIQALKAAGPFEVVVIDTMAQVTPGAEENGSADMGRALDHCKAISRATGAMMLLVAHAGKDVSRGIRGWSGIKGALDIEICVERAGKQRAATTTKVKDGMGEGVEYQFTLDNVLLRQVPDEDGELEDVTSCVLKHGVSQVKSDAPEKLTKQDHIDAWEHVQTLFDIDPEMPEATVLAAIAGLQTHPLTKHRTQAAKRIAEVLVAKRYLSASNGTFTRL